MDRVNHLVVASYNVRTDTSIDGSWSWDFRKKEVLNLISYHSWDIFGVQEIRPNQAIDLAQLTSYTAYTEEREGDLKGEGLGIFFKTEQFDCLDKGFFWLSQTPLKPSIHPEASYKRIALWMVLKKRQTGKEILVINTHLDNTSETARQEGVTILLEMLQEKINHYPTILLGDFNAERTETLHNELSKQFNYPKDQKEVIIYGPNGTFQNFYYDIDWVNLEEIDYIVYKDLSCIKQGVLTDSCNRRFPSDHFPIVTTFKL